MSRIENVLKYLGQVRSWQEFTQVQYFSAPKSLEEAYVKAKSNTEYFRTNYCIVITVWLLVWLLSHPKTLAILSILQSVWYFALSHSVLQQRQHLVASLAATLLMLAYTGVLTVCIVGIANASLPIAAHAVLRTPVDDFASDV
jgi:hypothetical protein